VAQGVKITIGLSPPSQGGAGGVALPAKYVERNSVARTMYVTLKPWPAARYKPDLPSGTI